MAFLFILHSCTVSERAKLRSGELRMKQSKCKWEREEQPAGRAAALHGTTGTTLLHQDIVVTGTAAMSSWEQWPLFSENVLWPYKGAGAWCVASFPVMGAFPSPVVEKERKGSGLVGVMVLISKRKLMEVFLLFIASGLAIQRKKRGCLWFSLQLLLTAMHTQVFSVFLSSHF